MIPATQRAPIRCWFSAVYIAMRSAEFGVHDTAMRCAMGVAGIGSVELTGEIFTRGARRGYGQRKCGIGAIVVLQQLYRQWRASDRN